MILFFYLFISNSLSPIDPFLSITVHITYFSFSFHLISLLFLQLSYKCFSSTNIHTFVIAVRVRIGLERLREGVIEERDIEVEKEVGATS